MSSYRGPRIVFPNAMSRILFATSSHPPPSALYLPFVPSVHCLSGAVPRRRSSWTLGGDFATTAHRSLSAAYDLRTLEFPPANGHLLRCDLLQVLVVCWPRPCARGGAQGFGSLWAWLVYLCD